MIKYFIIFYHLFHCLFVLPQEVCTASGCTSDQSTSDPLVVGARLAQQDLRLGLAYYKEELAKRPTEHTLRLLEAAAGCARKLKQFDLAETYDLAALRTKGASGASIYSFLASWVQVVEDQRMRGDFVAAASTISLAMNHIGAVSTDVRGLLVKLDSFVEECRAHYHLAISKLEEALDLSPSDSKSHLDDTVRLYLLYKRYGTVISSENIVVISEENTEQLPLDVIQKRKAELVEYLIEKGPWKTEKQMPHVFHPALTASPWHDVANYPRLRPLVKILTDNTHLLLEEYDLLFRQNLLAPDQDCIKYPSSGGWYRYEVTGVWNRLGTDGCSVDTPIGCRVLSDLRNTGVVPIVRAGYSAIDSGTWLQPHFGMTNGLLKFHLGLRVPVTEDGKSCTWFHVGDEKRTWKEKEVLFFDDSFVHEVSNFCDYSRVVFQVVIRHPDIPTLPDEPNEYHPVVVEAP